MYSLSTHQILRYLCIVLGGIGFALILSFHFLVGVMMLVTAVVAHEILYDHETEHIYREIENYANKRERQ